MKKLTYFLLVFVIAISSCKKDDINNVQDLVKKLKKGVWQFDRATENGVTRTIETFNVIKFDSDNTLRLYYTRKDASDVLFYRIKNANGNYQLYLYENKTKYDRDDSGSVGNIKYSNNEFTWEDGGTVAVYKYYSSMDKTRDLPKGSM